MNKPTYQQVLTCSRWLARLGRSTPTKEEIAEMSAEDVKAMTKALQQERRTSDVPNPFARFSDGSDPFEYAAARAKALENKGK